MREIIDYILSLLKSRFVPLIFMFITLFSVLVVKVFSLQIVNGEDYANTLTESIQMTTSVPATRGRIFDKNGVLLAYNELAFAVTISDSGVYEDTKIKNATVNAAIEETLNIIESKGDHFQNDFSIEYNAGGYEYNVSDNALLRFKRDVYGCKYVEQLTEEQRNSTAQEMIDYLCNYYEIDTNSISPQHITKIVSLRLNMTHNLYNRYIAFTISDEVSDETVAAILENSDKLVGVTVEQKYIRKYVDSIYCSQILGYTGTVSKSELETLLETDDSYELNDVVGKSGIEHSMESVLSGTKGSKKVYIDTFGRITEVLEETDSVAGNDIYLTIDIELQKNIYNAIEDKLVGILLQNMTAGDNKYSYNGDGEITSIYITAKEVYFALIDNNLVSLEKLSKGENPTESDVYNTFLNKKEATINWLREELINNAPPYGRLSEEEQVYIWYIYRDVLMTQKIFNMNNVDVNDEVYKDWTEGNSTSLQELLKYGITKNWIDLSKLSSQQYTSLSESYNEFVDYIFEQLENDTNFYKKMIQYMINNGTISGRQVCMLLFEQGFLEGEEDYQALNAGAISAYDFMRNAISSKRITPAQLALAPCSGACVITDVSNGDVLALVSYPSYDNNKLSGYIDANYYRQLNNDKSYPLRNWATQAQVAPGSTFKMCSSIAGVEAGVIGVDTAFYCSGAFTEVTPSPRCWNRSGHGLRDMATSIRDSCNVFFYNVGYRLACSKNGVYNSTYGTSILQKYAEEMGLATNSGIEIAEKAPSPSNDNAITSAIGQGNHQYSTLNLARYVTTIANSGTCYNLTLIDKIASNTGEVIEEKQPDIANQMNINPAIWNAVHSGMLMDTSISGLSISVASKTGTAQENKKQPDHAHLVAYAPFDNPQIGIAVSIRNGYASGEAAQLASTVLKMYFGLE